jgi:hypothetical protein
MTSGTILLRRTGKSSTKTTRIWEAQTPFRWMSRAPNGSTQALVLALGKDRNAYLLDRKDLGGVGGQLAKETVSATAIRTAPAAYPAADGVFVAFQGPGTRCPSSTRDNGLTVLKISITHNCNVRTGSPEDGSVWGLTGRRLGDRDHNGWTFQSHRVDCRR